MSASRGRFDTGVEGASGFWAQLPEFWSYTALKELEACPRRWMLLRAAYPDVWELRGYPQVPHPAALLGQVIHRALEVIVGALTSAGCTTTNTDLTVDVLRGLGGLSAVLREAINREVEALAGNPRLGEETRERLRQSLTDQLGVAANRVQLFLSRGTLPAWAATPSTEAGGEPPVERRDGPQMRSPAEIGAHPELDLVADELRLWGRVDLVTVADSSVTITDYKTGKGDPSHDDQVRLYALLWDLDRQTNPQGRQATTLVVSYPAGDRALPAPDTAALRSLEAATRARIASADENAVAVEPVAKPGPETCGFCQVRHLCADYWNHVAPEPTSVSPQGWFDLQGEVVRKNGIKSWVIQTKPGESQVLMRTASPSQTFPVGRTIRVLGVRRVVDPDEPELLIAALGSSSEAYLLRDLH